MESNRTTDDKFWSTQAGAFSFDEEVENVDEDRKYFGGNRDKAHKLQEELKAELNSNYSINSETSSSTSDDQPAEQANRMRELPQYLFSNNTIEQELDKETTFGFDEYLNIKPRKSFSSPEVERFASPPIDKTIRSLLTCDDVYFEHYKSFEEKKKLLARSIEINDGNAILAVVLFLFRTLRPSLFRQLLVENRTAADHYIHYLETRNEINHLIDLLNLLGRTTDSLIIFYKKIMRTQGNIEKCSKELEHFYRADCKLSDDWMAHIIIEQINLLATHKAIKEKMASFSPRDHSSVLRTLAYLAEHFYESSNPSLSPTNFKTTYNLNVKQYAWPILHSLVKTQSWPQIESLLLTKSWLNITNSKDKCILPLESVCLCLKNAPVDLITRFLRLIDDQDKKLNMAKRLKCHSVVIDCYSSLKDRGAILNYRSNLQENSKEAIYCDSVLKNQSLKWKN